MYTYLHIYSIVSKVAYCIPLKRRGADISVPKVSPLFQSRWREWFAQTWGLQHNLWFETQFGCLGHSTPILRYHCLKQKLFSIIPGLGGRRNWRVQCSCHKLANFTNHASLAQSGSKNATASFFVTDLTSIHEYLSIRAIQVLKKRNILIFAMKLLTQERQTGGSQYCEMLSHVYGGAARPGYQWVNTKHGKYEKQILMQKPIQF